MDMFFDKETGRRHCFLHLPVPNYYCTLSNPLLFSLSLVVCSLISSLHPWARNSNLYHFDENKDANHSQPHMPLPW